MTVSSRPLEVVDLAPGKDWHLGQEPLINEYLSKPAVIEQVFHDQEIHLRDLRLSWTFPCFGLPESELIASENFGEKSGPLQHMRYRGADWLRRGAH